MSNLADPRCGQDTGHDAVAGAQEESHMLGQSAPVPSRQERRTASHAEVFKRAQGNFTKFFICFLNLAESLTFFYN